MEKNIRPANRIDLHTHSTCSDGSFSPRQLVRLARKRGLRALAFTDHDTVAGVEKAAAAGKELDVEVVPGGFGFSRGPEKCPGSCQWRARAQHRLCPATGCEG
ncbi:MAG: PHP domain-containing protein [Syntrophobacteria bacterium]